MKALSFALMAAAALVAAPLSAQAQSSLQIDYNINLVAGDEPDGTAPWLRVLFEDDPADPNTVVATITGLFNPSTSANFVSNIGFNVVDDSQEYLDDITRDAACFALTAGVNCTTAAAIIAGSTNGQEVNNWKGFDLQFFLPPPRGGSTNTLGVADIVKYTLKAPGLRAVSFNTRSQPPTPGNLSPTLFYSVAKIQATSGPERSTTIAGTPGGGPDPRDLDDVPGPLGVAGALGMFGWSRRLRRRISDVG